ncbi:MAG: hypothetical protein ABFE07_28815 [Armatimonadia bacterium]
MSQPERVELTDSEWMELIDMTREGLPDCCANISAFRDAVITLAREGGELNVLSSGELLKTFAWASEGHDLNDLPIVHKLMRQVYAFEKWHKEERKP